MNTKHPCNWSLHSFLTAGDDYVAMTTPLSIATSPAERCVNISTLPDEVTEGSETFSVSLSTNDRAVVFGSPNASVVITDQSAGMCREVT